MTPFSLWLAAGAILITAEVLTGELTLASLSMGCFAAALFAWLGFEQIIQVPVAATVSLAATLWMAPWLRRHFAPPRTPSPSEALLGSHAEVCNALTPGQYGTVKLNGVLWQAESVAAAAVGTQVLVLKVEGARLQVLPLELLNEPNPAPSEGP
ncbi:MAG: NfeD family protein [Candidatus Sericytochromatia bacterium]|nr:NfeD family protein [Candidatus Sericytochromatia bacterium]